MNQDEIYRRLKKKTSNQISGPVVRACYGDGGWSPMDDYGNVIKITFSATCLAKGEVRVVLCKPETKIARKNGRGITVLWTSNKVSRTSTKQVAAALYQAQVVADAEKAKLPLKGIVDLVKEAIHD